MWLLPKEKAPQGRNTIVRVAKSWMTDSWVHLLVVGKGRCVRRTGERELHYRKVYVSLSLSYLNDFSIPGPIIIKKVGAAQLG
jgi:hypothetical protein